MSEEQDEIIDYSKEIAKLLKSAANWEDHLVPAPMCIAFLGKKRLSNLQTLFNSHGQNVLKFVSFC